MLSKDVVSSLQERVEEADLPVDEALEDAEWEGQNLVDAGSDALLPHTHHKDLPLFNDI